MEDLLRGGEGRIEKKFENASTGNNLRVVNNSQGTI